ncbi:MAG: hypothetical protein OEW45_19845, partial [Deltaproteobacteria bacterium]|nr:hypothetical protein [Deltaproteobacteria bacterium]
TPRQAIAEPMPSLLAKAIPPDSGCGKVLPPSWHFYRTLVWARKPGRFAPAASVGILHEKGKGYFIRRRGRGVSSRLIFGEITAS